MAPAGNGYNLSNRTACNWLPVALLAAVFLLSLAVGGTAQAILPLAADQQFSVLEDVHAQQSISQVSAEKSRQNFVPATVNRASANQSTSALWLKFTLPASSSTQRNRLLVIGPGYLDEVALYRTGYDTAITAPPQLSGDAVPFGEKPFPNRLHVFPLTADRAEYYMRATSEGLLSIEWDVVDEETFLSSDRAHNIGYAVLLGILSTMIFFNLGIFLGMGDKTYAYYVSYHTCTALLIYSLSGYSSQFLWPTISNSTNTSIPIALIGMSLSGLLFTHSFLDIDHRLPRHARLMHYTVALVCLLAIPGLLLPYSEGVKFTYGGCFIVLAVLSFVVIMAGRAKIAAAKYIAISFGLAILPGSLGAFSYELGLLPFNLFSSHMLEITTVTETLLLSLFLAYRIKLSETEKLAAQQKNIDLQANINERILAKQEEERSRIARELHDSVGPNLSALHIHLRSLAAMDGAESGTQPMMSDEQSVALLKQTITDVRQLSHNLHPSQLDRLSLTSAIEIFTQQFHGEDMPAFKLVMDVAEDLIPENKKIHLFRIVQEAVHNIIGHSGASHCHLSLTRVAGKIQLSIRDNGCGFDPLGSNGNGLGMTSMADRASIMNAQLDIDAQVEEGTCISVQFNALSADD